jgi:hypothetical protein
VVEVEAFRRHRPLFALCHGTLGTEPSQIQSRYCRVRCRRRRVLGPSRGCNARLCMVPGQTLNIESTSAFAQTPIRRRMLFIVGAILGCGYELRHSSRRRDFTGGRLAWTDPIRMLLNSDSRRRGPE